MNAHPTDTILDLARKTGGRKSHTVLADPPWRFINRTGKVAPEHKRLSRYETMDTSQIASCPSQISPFPLHIFIFGSQMRCCLKDCK